MTIINSDEELKEFCIKKLEEYDDDLSEINTDSLEELISHTIQSGQQHVLCSMGWGVQYIVKGDNLINLK